MQMSVQAVVMYMADCMEHEKPWMPGPYYAEAEARRELDKHYEEEHKEGTAI